MDITVNETLVSVTDGATLRDVRDTVKPEADVLVVNGFPEADDAIALAEGDHVSLIRRGEVPSADELEALLFARHSPGVHERVKRAVVGIAGVGGLGSAVALALARLGVGTLVVADHDVVEPSNLNRQQYFVDQIGLPKVGALSATLERVNPFVRVVAHQERVAPDNVAGLFGDVDVMVEAFDAPKAKAMLAECFRAERPGVPLVMASGMAGSGSAESIALRRAGRDLYIAGDGVATAGPGEGLMAPRVGIVAHLQANAVLRLLLGLDAV